jgi:hypothetical protein
LTILGKDPMQLDRRDLLAGFAFARSPERRIDADGTHFVWQHAGGRIVCAFAANADGWIAAGFNEVRDLRGTRFVVAAAPPGLVAERLARVPDHIAAPVPALVEARVARAGARVQLDFVFPQEIPGGPSLAPGTRAHVMLAWSHDRDFAHHSAWRRHFDVVL